MDKWFDLEVCVCSWGRNGMVVNTLNRGTLCSLCNCLTRLWSYLCVHPSGSWWSSTKRALSDVTPPERGSICSHNMKMSRAECVFVHSSFHCSRCGRTFGPWSKCVNEVEVIITFLTVQTWNSACCLLTCIPSENLCVHVCSIFKLLCVLCLQGFWQAGIPVSG